MQWAGDPIRRRHGTALVSFGGSSSWHPAPTPTPTGCPHPAAAWAAPPCAGIKVAVRRFLGGFDENGFLAEDAAADEALSGVDPREAARRASDPINGVDIAAAGGLLRAGLSRLLALPRHFRLLGSAPVVALCVQTGCLGAWCAPAAHPRHALTARRMPPPLCSAGGVPAGGGRAASADAGGQRAADAHAAGGAQADFRPGVSMASCAAVLVGCAPPL